MPPARVIAGPRALLTSIVLVIYEGALSVSGGWRANPRIELTPGAGRSFRGSLGLFDWGITAPLL
jgi:hypothetical protein